jgi:phosphatidate cytidylyltransferase
MLKWRAVSFPLLLALVGVIFFSPPMVGGPIFFFCALVMISFANYECARMMNCAGIENYPVLSAVLSVLLLSALLVMALFGWDLARAVIPVSLLPWVLILFGREDAVKRIFTTVGAVLMTVIPFGLVASMYFPEQKFLLFVILVTKAMDTGGYIFGMLSAKLLPGGNHKLCPSISPKKSWEGAIGGTVLSMAVAWCLYRFCRNWNYECWIGNLRLWKFLALGFLLALASIAGDLTESALKRKCSVKDSGSWIPGMGGALDVLDSFIYVAPVTMVFAALVKHL